MKTVETMTRAREEVTMTERLGKLGERRRTRPKATAPRIMPA